ncbi:MAG: Fic family protein [Muribaculaceae bacterium]|nr:Fic family protein [Muribaculaceae bacterium]MBR5435976.1 Fic family protein [Muribaculaceae bacterium]
MYIPPFNLTSNIVNLIAEISAKIERYSIRLEQSDGLKLRRINRMRTIHSSLAIEGNTLTENEVREIINGKNVVAPIKQIQEVKNAIAAYDLWPELNPFDVNDLLRAHGVMMQSLADDAGAFRKGGVGVFSEKGMVHMAPPAHNVPTLINQLFEWLSTAEDHLLVRSCVFHYEFEFIHPFSDGNGRIGRLWQSLILGKLNPVFEFLPVENMVFANQDKYYEAINNSSKIGDSGPFIHFMLGEILNALSSHLADERLPLDTDVDREFGKLFGEQFGIKFGIKFGINEKRTLLLLHSTPTLTAAEIAERIGISRRGVELQIKKFRELGLLLRAGSNKRGQWVINKD